MPLPYIRSFGIKLHELRKRRKKKTIHSNRVYLAEILNPLVPEVSSSVPQNNHSGDL